MDNDAKLLIGGNLCSNQDCALRFEFSVFGHCNGASLYHDQQYKIILL